MNKSEIPFLPATQLARLIQTREVSPVEATQAYLDRIEQVDGKLNSYITVCNEEALASARQAEADISAGHYKGPMHGIPVAVKDQFNTNGIRTTNGSNVHRDFIPDHDATVVANLKQAGSVLLGKLNMSEFASGDAFHHPYGRPRNPWDLSRNPGTSSSGSGAATAACLCSTSLGEDTGGSIRGPASFCGLVGIRPSWGRVSRYGVFGASWSMDTVGPISRTTADCAMTLGAIAGYDSKDPLTWNVPVPDYLSALTNDIAGLKVGVVTERVHTDVVETEVGNAVVKAIAVLGELGASVEEVSLPLIVDSAAISSAIIASDIAALNRDNISTRLDQFDHNNQVRMLMGSILPAAAYQKATRLRQALRQQILDALARVDVLVMPTSSIPAPVIPEQAGIGGKQEVIDGFAGRRSFTSPFNLANTPALSINCGFTSQNLPIGLQIAGKPFDETTIFRVAHAYEQATDWHTRRPPI
ncbi:MAG: Asp-tRNA(Asn)/Glu-tRNA(Gln) amidotransferase subunit GatA [Chloroflexi bacterium]|nr:Asp-tRNA(Asn)/Glu-tRNA(Gln) amidotransferase subunit GatA [Chloroflexota bacterium]